MTVRTIATLRKCRKGEPFAVTGAGAYWLAVNCKIANRGGDGIGNSAPDIQDFYRVRVYRDGHLRAYITTTFWHENGDSLSHVRCDETLDAETIEDLVVAIKNVRHHDSNKGFDADPDYLQDEFEQLPAAAPSPDEEVAE